MKIGVKDFKTWLTKTHHKLQENRQYLTELDQTIGDGDHGINMERGFRVVVEKINDTEYDDLQSIVKDIAMTIIANVGGASGPLYGTAFLRMAPVFSQEKKVDVKTFVKGLEAALEGIQARGKAAVGEKTLVDVWAAVIEGMKQKGSFDADGLERIAKQSAEKTKELMATKGRAAYFKEKSIGHIDPGAMSSYYLFSSFAEVIEEKSE